MNAHADTERILDAFLAPEADRLPDRVIDGALATIARTPQRRAARAPWRIPMSVFARVAAVAAIVLIIGGVLYVGGFVPTPTPTSNPSAEPTALPTTAPLDPSGWSEIQSPAYGYTASVPTSMRPTFGTLPNTVDAFVGPDQLDTFFGAPGPSIFAWSIELPTDVSTDAWISMYVDQVNTAADPCVPRPETWPRVTVDGQPGWRYSGCNGWEEAMVVVRSHAYVFSVSNVRNPADSPALLTAFLSTVRLHPEDALRGDATVVTFQSAEHQFTAQIPSTWVARPATKAWAVGERVGRNQPNVDLFTPGISVGDAAYVASQPVPSGTTLAGWIAAWLGTREELDGFCSYSTNGWEAVTVGDRTFEHRPMLCTGAAHDTPAWDQYAIVIGDRGYVVAGTPSMVERLVANLGIQGSPSEELFTSSEYGYSILYPAGWSAAAATRPWSIGADRDDRDSAAADRFTSADSAERVTAWAEVDVPGIGVTSFLTIYCGEDSSCMSAVAKAATITMLGQPATLVHFADRDLAIVEVDGIFYGVTAWHPSSAGRLEAFVAGLQLGAGPALTPFPQASTP